MNAILPVLFLLLAGSAEVAHSSAIDVARGYWASGDLAWEAEGYRDDNSSYKLLNAEASFGDPNSFVYNYEGIIAIEDSPPEDRVPICLAMEGYHFVPDGAFTSYEKGGKVTAGAYKNGLKHGKWTYLYRAAVGDLGLPEEKAAEGEFKDGVKEGHWIYYDQFCKNMKKAEGDYSNGMVVDGTWRTYEYT